MSFGREILEGISNFEKSILVRFYTQQKSQTGSKDSNLGPSGSLFGTFWIILKHFRLSVGPLGAPHGHAWEPQNWKKVGQRVFLEFHRFLRVHGGAQKGPKGPPKGGKRCYKSAKWHPRAVKVTSSGPFSRRLHKHASSLWTTTLFLHI